MMVQEPGLLAVAAGMVPPVRLTVRGGVVEAVPPQVVVAEPGTTVRTVPGNVSDMTTPVYATDDGFSNVMVSVVVPPAGKLPGEKALRMRTACTLSVAEAGALFVSPC